MYKETLSAGVPVSWNISGRHFRLVDTTGPVNIEFYRNGAEVSEAIEVEAGYSEWWPEESRGFDKVTITSATAQTVKFVTRMESRVEYDRAVGNVAVTNNNGTILPYAGAGVTTSSVQVRPAKADRRYFLLQNKSASGTVWIRTDGGAVTAATGLKIPPGGSVEFQGFVPSGAITWIADVAIPASDVLILEG